MLNLQVATHCERRTNKADDQTCDKKTNVNERVSLTSDVHGQEGKRRLNLGQCNPTDKLDAADSQEANR